MWNWNDRLYGKLVRTISKWHLDELRVDHLLNHLCISFHLFFYHRRAENEDRFLDQSFPKTLSFKRQMPNGFDAFNASGNNASGQFWKQTGRTHLFTA